MFNGVVCYPPSVSPTPDITGPVVGASDRQRTQTSILDFFRSIFFLEFFRSELDNDVIGARFINIGRDMLVRIARLEDGWRCRLNVYG